MKKLILTTLAALTVAQPLMAKTLYCGVSKQKNGKGDYLPVVRIQQTINSGDSVVLKGADNKVIQVDGQRFMASLSETSLAILITPNANQVFDSMAMGDAFGKQLTLFKKSLVLSCLVY
jgi:hypothetical protein